jgi:hypothetical protein
MKCDLSYKTTFASKLQNNSLTYYVYKGKLIRCACSFIIVAATILLAILCYRPTLGRLVHHSFCMQRFAPKFCLWSWDWIGTKNGKMQVGTVVQKGRAMHAFTGGCSRTSATEDPSTYIEARQNLLAGREPVTPNMFPPCHISLQGGKSADKATY